MQIFGAVGLLLTFFWYSSGLPRSAVPVFRGDQFMHHHHSVNKRDTVTYHVDETENTAEHWVEVAQKKLKEQLNKKQIEGLAKNVILFLGDGMSIPTLVGARAYQGQLQGESGEGSKLSFEEFPFTGLSKTYCVDRQVPDSACSATAYLCGVKANYGTLGVSAAVHRDDCGPMNNQSNHVSSIGRWSQLAGKSTGIITTTRITHASPAGVYSHTAERDWESDLDVEEAGMNATQCLDIASQLVYGDTGINFDVILGGGRKKFLPNGVKDEENQAGERLDGVNLIEEWKKLKSNLGVNAEYIWNRKQLLDIDDNIDNVLGLFESDHLQFHMDATVETEPTLAEMTIAAIKILSKNPNGYFLFIEGGRIDHAHHLAQAHKALDETLELSKAVNEARKVTNVQDTLIVVTSDHAHTMSMSGYPNRGNDIFGIAGMSDLDNLPYSTLSYANGPGFQAADEHGIRHDIRKDDMSNKNYQFPSIAPISSETHGGDDVGIFASGPWAHLLVGVVEQNVIPHVMAYASCVGSGVTVCDT